MNRQKGFIQIPLLIAIIAGILVLGGGGYLGFKQYQKEREQTRQQAEAQQKALENAQTQAAAQQKALEDTQAEIEKLKQDNESIKKEQEQTNSNQLDQSISSSDMAPYIGAIGVMFCGTNDYSTTQYGTGVLYKLGKLMTNWHVVEGMDWCRFSSESFLGNAIYDDPSHYRIGAYIVDLAGITWPNINADFAVIPFHKQIISSAPVDEYLNVGEMNYNVESLNFCSKKVAIGTPVAILGYPASSINLDQWWPPMSVTTGIVSGYDLSSSSVIPNYIVSAKVDHGNSGGLALGKENGKVCFLGVPTWVVTGQVESAGIVQNVHYLFK